MRYTWNSCSQCYRDKFPCNWSIRFGGWLIFSFLDLDDPNVHFANSASVQHAVTLGIDLPCSITPVWSSCIPLSQYKSQAVCCKERLRVIEFDRTAILFFERVLNCTKNIVP